MRSKPLEESILAKKDEAIAFDLRA